MPENVEVDTDKAEELLTDLSTDEVDALVKLVGNLDRLEIKDGAPRFSEIEMDLIGRFDDLLHGRSAT